MNYSTLTVEAPLGIILFPKVTTIFESINLLYAAISPAVFLRTSLELVDAGLPPQLPTTKKFK